MSNDVMTELEDKLKKSLAALNKDFSKLRTGVASVTLLEDIKIDYYKQPTPLNQVATIGVPDSRTITIQPWDNTVIAEIEKAIQKSDLGVNPMSTARTIGCLPEANRGEAQGTHEAGQQDARGYPRRHEKRPEGHKREAEKAGKRQGHFPGRSQEKAG